jgi:glyoxylase-like metal-dependent hydrolase (beta-lactamase superfamily II)
VSADPISPDSGQHWAVEGAWQVATGIHRVPLPLPLDGLRAVNVYVVETADGLVLIDAGWAIVEARQVLEWALHQLGYGPKDVRQFLVTHAHRDHYTMAALFASEFGCELVLGEPERPALDAAVDWAYYHDGGFVGELAAAGAVELTRAWVRRNDPPDPRHWRYPDVWLRGERTIDVGDRVLTGIHTPGHTPGHYVFTDASAGLLFAGDHILPIITPSIGFTVPTSPDPLRHFMDSLTKIRQLPDQVILPAHGPVAPSTHERIDELLTHHERRLTLCLGALESGAATAYEVAQKLPWTRHERSFGELDVFNQGMATLESRAHLDLLVARGLAARDMSGQVAIYAPATPALPS